MKRRYVPIVFTHVLWGCAGFTVAAASVASCTYTLPTVDGSAGAGGNGAGGNGAGGSGAAGGGGAGSMCSTGLTPCDNACVDTTLDPAHCGGCNKVCPMGHDCTNAQCQATVCTAFSVKPCYDGPQGTLNVGPCREGARTCLADETGYGPCMGQVLPMKDDCGNDLDEDCNGSPDMGASCLTDAGLVVRYVLDEAASGMETTMAMDSAANPLHLKVDYGAGDNMSYTEAPTGRGLHWLAPGLSGAAYAPIDGTKVYVALEGKTQGTIELVADVQAVNPVPSRLFTIGFGAESGRFTLVSGDIGRLQFFWLNNVVAGDWPIGFATLGRAVLHLVLDTTDATPANRVRLFVNGALVVGNPGFPPSQNATIVIGTGRSLYLGNRDEFIRSFAGSLYYAALYDRPLLDNEIGRHASHLATHDDQ